MPKKSRDQLTLSELARQLESGEIDTSMVLLIKKNGDRLYLHSFDTEISALEFLEIMSAGLRADIFETLTKRFLN